MAAIASTPTSESLKVGPMDPDNTAELTARVGVGNNALELLKGQADNQPPELMAILAIPPDGARSEALVYDEVVRGAGDLLDREGAELLAAYVRGDSDRTRAVTIHYKIASGRTGKASIGLWTDFPQSVRAFEDTRRLKMGLGSALAQLDNPEDTPPAASPELEALKAALEDQQKELAELRNPEPVEGYRALNARDAALRVYEMDGSQVDATERFERTAGGDSGPRKTVMAAIEKRRSDLAQQATDLEALRAARAAGDDPLSPTPAGDGDDTGTGS